VTGLTDAQRALWRKDAEHFRGEGAHARVLALLNELAAHEAREARVRALAITFTRYAEERAALVPVGGTGRLDAMERRESGTWARAAGLLLDALDGSPA